MKSAPPHESLFNLQKAENEPWLSDVFIPLPAFERLKENHSTILYGDIGSGKTALRLELQKQKKDEEIFNTSWLPEPILENPTNDTTLAHQVMRQAVRTFVENLILKGNLPQRLREPSSHIISALQWFMKNYLPFEPGFYIQSQKDQLTLDESQWYQRVLQTSSHPIVTEQTKLSDQINLLLMILRSAKYERLWLMVDGFERWTPRQTGEQVTAFLDAILSMLIIFDMPGVIFKLFIPASFKRVVHETIGVERHRAEEIQIEWSVESLQAMLKKRMAYSLSSEKVSIDSLCESNEFILWLKEFGGISPRSWLQFTAPLVFNYQMLGKRLNVAQTREFIYQHPAPFQLNYERREVWLGKKCISIGSAPEFRVLEYLAAQSGKICSLEELYYYAQAELETVPDRGDPQWVNQKAWRGAMDTLIWRLRQKIEPNPREPLYLITHHGKGLELIHVNL